LPTAHIAIYLDQHGIYIANTIARVQNTFITTLNTKNKDQIVNINDLNHESLSNYDVVKGDFKDREKTVLT